MNEVMRVVERSPQLLRHKGLPFRKVGGNTLGPGPGQPAGCGQALGQTALVPGVFRLGLHTVASSEIYKNVFEASLNFWEEEKKPDVEPLKETLV